MIGSVRSVTIPATSTLVNGRHESDRIRPAYGARSWIVREAARICIWYGSMVVW